MFPMIYCQGSLSSPAHQPRRYSYGELWYSDHYLTIYIPLPKLTPNFNLLYLALPFTNHCGLAAHEAKRINILTVLKLPLRISSCASLLSSLIRVAALFLFRWICSWRVWVRAGGHCGLGGQVFTLWSWRLGYLNNLLMRKLINCIYWK